MTMLKLKNTALEILDDGKAYYGGRILGARELPEGVEVGDYRNRYLEAPEDAVQISTLRPELEVTYNGKALAATFEVDPLA